MPVKTYPNSLLNNSVENVMHYWNNLNQGNNAKVPYQEKLQELNGLFEEISSKSSILILAWDMAKDRFVYAVDKKNIVGHEPSLYLAEDGISFSISNMHPDFITACLSMQYKAMEYIIEYKGELSKITANIDGRYKKSNGDYIHYLQQTICLESGLNGQPFLFLGYIHDITYLKKKESANLVITTPDEIKLWNFNFDNQTLAPVQSISVQEKNILSYLKKGKDSKEIAKELYLSPHTIDTHRRNLLKKTNCVDTSGLITYAKLVGLL
jgi:DNA-binding CsgD family transcriptional regulator